MNSKVYFNLVTTSINLATGKNKKDKNLSCAFQLHWHYF